MIESDDQRQALAQFLSDEVRSLDYADLLLERAADAARGGEVPGASGNAYYVGFGQDGVVIEHHHLPHWPALRLSHADFVAAVTTRRAALVG